MSKVNRASESIDVLCAISIHPDCTIHPAVADRITRKDLGNLFSGPTATLPDPNEGSAEERYLTVTTFKELPVVASHTERDGEAALLGVRPATRREAAAYRRLVTRRLRPSEAIADAADALETSEIGAQAMARAVWRMGGESLAGVDLVMRVEGR